MKRYIKLTLKSIKNNYLTEPDQTIKSNQFSEY